MDRELKELLIALWSGLQDYADERYYQKDNMGETISYLTPDAAQEALRQFEEYEAKHGVIGW